MLCQIYIEALLVDVTAADAIYAAMESGENNAATAAVCWLIIASRKSGGDDDSVKIGTIVKPRSTRPRGD